MTLSNFDWTDKNSVRWFILLPTGHEGPYSLDALLGRKISPNVKIWAEGLSEPLTLKAVLAKEVKVSEPVVPLLEDEDEIPPPLPPLPEEDESSVPPAEEIGPTGSSFLESKNFKYLLGAGLVIGFAFFGLTAVLQGQEKFVLRRANKMSPELHDKIMRDFKFEGWDKKIFFKEYVPADMSHIWLVTSGFQHCDVEASFMSLSGKLLSKGDEKINFKTKGQLANHLVEFSTFDFSSGNRIIPGLYEMDLKATNCKWDGLLPKLGNKFLNPEASYVSRMKVVLFNKGNEEFNHILDNLIRKKLALEIKNQNQEELFWEDLQQKLQTLLAITLQIEQLMTDFLDEGPSKYDKALRPMVDQYTKKFGHFLTNFVVANEEYFKGLEKSDLSNMDAKRGYEAVVRLTSKNIGFESMKLIEEMQALKKPKPAQIKELSAKAHKTFEALKENINSKIIQVTEDRVN